MTISHESTVRLKCEHVHYISILTERLIFVDHFISLLFFLKVICSYQTILTFLYSWQSNSLSLAYS